MERVTAVLCLLTLAGLAAAQTQLKTGPAIGQKIPDFQLRDQHGNLQTFESIRGPKGALILFYRSADW
ncbi:MAG: hypothetical protein WD696_02480 [Bryobacteraceae bacterium]